MISAIVAVTDNDVISKEGKIPWHMPADFRHLKQITMGHPIIMGRKTHESIGQALPGRSNLVITSNKNYQAAQGCEVVGSIDEAVEKAKSAEGGNEVFIFGGESIYNQALPITERIYLTRVHTEVDGDTFFKFNQKEWRKISSEKHKADDNNPYDWDWYVLERVKT